MPVDEPAQVEAETIVCMSCGSAIPAGMRVVDANGSILCRICDADRQPLVELQIDRDPPEGDEAEAGESLYECSVCRGQMPAERVYESGGVITCVECWDRAHPQTSSAQSAAPPPPRPRAAPPPPARQLLLAKVTCPHCWRQFPPQEILWVSRHAELIGDLVAGPDASLRFLPSQFTVDGAARDPRGMICQMMACPGCHLVVPRAMVETEALFTSIAGVSGSGKSYFLASMTWELRRLLPLHFGVSFNDVDPSFNHALSRHEETLFLAPDPQQPVKLDQTDAAGALLYDQVRLNQRAVTLPRPFLFMMRPTGRHPNIEAAAQLARVVCLYDNAGEHFNPGQETTGAPVTQHLGSSRVLMFLYDPTQDPRLRARLREFGADPQLADDAPTHRQETILTETIARVCRSAGLPSTHPIKRPLLVVVSKADVWGKAIDLDLSTEPIIPESVAKGVLDGVDLDRVENVSAAVRGMLLETAPEFVSAAEDLCSKVVYIPVSALGHAPEPLPDRPGLWVRPGQIKPRWVTVPFLYMFARWSHDVIGGVRAEQQRTTT